jgi:hypothetical protein
MNPTPNTNLPQPQPADPSWIVLVQFGQRLPNGHCGHLGICSTEDAALPNPAPKAHRCQFALASVSASANGHPIFDFPLNQMRPCTARIFFGKPWFVMPFDLEIPGSWEQHLPDIRTPVIRAGYYSIDKFPNFFRIDFGNRCSAHDFFTTQ